jgi:peptidyl-prolyl cis-trans isomerase D
MIGTIRKYIHKSGAKVIVWLTLLSLAGGSFVSLMRFSRRFGSVDALATVNGYDVPLMEYRRRFLTLSHLITEVRRLYGPQADVILSMWGLGEKPEQVTLERIIQEKVAQSMADTALGTHVSREYIESKLRDPLFIREFLGDIVPPQVVDRGTLNVDLLKRALERQGLSEADFEQEVKGIVQRYMLDRLMQGGLYVPEAALKDLYLKAFAKKKFGIASLGMQGYTKKARAQKVSEQEITQYFDEHKENYRVPEKRSARLWTFAYDVPVGAKEIENWYNQHRSEFVAKPEELLVQRIVVKADEKNALEKRQEAQKLMKKAKKNAGAFEELARKYSQASEKGAPLTVRRGQKEGLFESTVFSLQQGEISPVIQTKEGFEVLKVVEKRVPTYKSLNEVRQEIEKKLKRDKFVQDFSTNAQRVLSQAHDMPEIFKRFIEEKKAQESAVKDQEPKETVQAEKLFGLSKKGDKAFYVEGDKGFIIELTDKKESFVPELNAVHDQVLKDLYQAKAQALLKDDLGKIREHLKEGIDKAAQLVGARTEKTDWIDPQHPLTMKKVSAPLQRAQLLTEVGSSVEEVTDQTGYLIELIELEPLDSGAFESKKEELRLYIYQSELPLLHKSFQEQARAKAQVTVNEELWRGASSHV